MNMHIKVSATEANRSFSRLLREVARGKHVTVTSHGRDVAVVVPVETESEDAKHSRRLAARERLKAHWATVEPVTIGPWTREDLYERD